MEGQVDFLYKSQFTLDNLLLSGRVLVNDPLGAYVNKVADKLLESDPKLRSELHFYILKSAQVNAFSYHQGIILVNVGLLAQVENEAQLAFILSHEIAHYVKKHALSTYIEFKDIDETDYDDDRFNERITYSKEHESEADMEGLSIYKRSGYSLKEVIKAYDVLQYSYLPFDDIEFKKSFFEDEYLSFPDSTYSLREVSQIVSDDNFDDSKSTHPNIRKRKNALEGKVNDDDSGRKKYLVSQDEFKKTQTTARFESCRLQLISRNYPEAMYSAYMLLKKYPQNIYLKKIVCSALYNLAAYRAPSPNAPYDMRLSDYTSYSFPDYKKIEGSSQQLYYFLSQLSDQEFTTLALSWSWKLKKQFPEEKYVSRVCDSLFVLMIKHGLTPTEFYTQSKDELKKELEDLRIADSLKLAGPKKDSADGEEESKYDKIKKKQTKEVIKTSEIKGSMYFAFVDLLKDKEFRERYNYFVNQNNRSMSTHTEVVDKYFSYTSPGLGLDQLIVYDPLRLRMDSRRGRKKMDYRLASQNEKEFVNLITTNCDRSKLPYRVIDPEALDSVSIEGFNDYEVMTDWLNESIKISGSKYALPLATEEIEEVRKKYNGNDLLLSGVISQRFNRINHPGLYALGFVIWPLIPAYVVYGVIPKYRTFYYDILLDMNNGKILYKQLDQLRQNDTSYNINMRTGKMIATFKKKPVVKQ